MNERIEYPNGRLIESDDVQSIRTSSRSQWDKNIPWILFDTTLSDSEQIAQRLLNVVRSTQLLHFIPRFEPQETNDGYVQTNKDYVEEIENRLRKIVSTLLLSIDNDNKCIFAKKWSKWKSSLTSEFKRLLNCMEPSTSELTVPALIDDIEFKFINLCKRNIMMTDA
eukprot:GHVL01024175.1.p1 GENE.GHVL01024175.1~~GHVL01024175.1.p1  ORF type:complete len:167 (-),score=26.86 GHVL01024175.1:37-537(-)